MNLFYKNFTQECSNCDYPSIKFVKKYLQVHMVGMQEEVSLWIIEQKLMDLLESFLL